MFFKKPRQEEEREWYIQALFYFLAIFVVLVGYFIGQIPMFGLMFYKMSQNEDIGESELAEFSNNPDFGLFDINSNVGLILMLLMFVFALGALIFIIKALHGRNLKDLINPHQPIRWNRAFWAFGVWILLGAAFESVLYFMHPENYQFQFNLSSFLPLLLICIFLLPLQTSFEELFFRGYLMQGIGRGSKSKLAALILTSILFGLIHGMNPEVTQYGFWTMQSYYVSAGLLLGIVTIMDDGLELALGLHAGTNIFGALFLSYEGSAIQTDSLFRSSEIDPQLMFLFLILMSIVFLVICKFKFKWGSFSKLYEKVEEKYQIADRMDVSDHLI